MIDIQTKIHDQFSIEFKVGFSGREDVKQERFDVNSWIFIPNGLDINTHTYSKERFYTDMKSNVRLITPSFLLKEMIEGEDCPLQHVRKSFEEMLRDPSDERKSEFVFQLKLFGSIFKSAIRNESAEIMKHSQDGLALERCMAYIENLRSVLKSYRDLFNRKEALSEEVLSNVGFTDEFISHQVEIRTMKIVRAFWNSSQSGLKEAIDMMAEFLERERVYKTNKGYSHAVVGDEINNRKLLFRHSLLKKYIESALFLKVDTTQDGQAVKQISFSLAAGLAMMVSMLVTLPFQKYLGNYPNLIFIILIVIYMLKDRIKELTRWLFAYQLKDKYYDNKTVARIKNRPVGTIKEGMDFITDDKVPEEVLRLRRRNRLENDNQLLQEKIILYRKKVAIDNEVLKNQYDYDFRGINDIIRYHINYLTKKMDNPVSSIDILDEHRQLVTLKAERTYVLHFVMQFKWEDQVEYKSFRVVVNRSGIISITSQE